VSRSVRGIAIVLVGGAAGLAAGCGAAHKSSGSVELRSTITRVEGGTTVVVTETAIAATAEGSPPPAATKKDVEDSGYLACKNIPTSLVRAANRSHAGLVRLARMVGAMLSMAFSKDQLVTAAIGCARALRQKGLRPTLPPPSGSNA
jgi:hypothetical protein